MVPVIISMRIEKGSAVTLEVNFKDPSGLIADVANESVVDMSGYYIKGEHGAGIEAVVTGGSGRVLLSGYFVSNI